MPTATPLVLTPSIPAATPPRGQVYVFPTPSELPDTTENRLAWSQYRWPAGGDEWSEAWGSTDALWAATIYPRLHAFVPAESVLEIAPGFGRITQYLQRIARRLTIVDVTEKCIEHCRKRFEGASNINYVVNDGVSLPSVADASVDLAVSWDSLVHVERTTIAAYLRELARTLRPGAYALLHHSNLGSARATMTDAELRKIPGGRRASMSAAAMREDAPGFGLRVLTQELIPWNDHGMLTDCLTLLRNEPIRSSLSPQVIEHWDWREELAGARRLSVAYRARVD
jgi:SAM-dependent methyltransferase